MVAALERILGIATMAFGVTALAVATGGCTRTSDGSYVMRRPAMFSHFLGARRDQPGLAQVEALPPAYTLAPVASAPVMAPPRSKRPKLAMPSLRLSKNPPFKRADPDKPLTCRNETGAGGRIRIVCT